LLTSPNLGAWTSSVGTCSVSGAGGWVFVKQQDFAVRVYGDTAVTLLEAPPDQ